MYCMLKWFLWLLLLIPTRLLLAAATIVLIFHAVLPGWITTSPWRASLPPFKPLPPFHPTEEPASAGEGHWEQRGGTP